MLSINEIVTKHFMKHFTYTYTQVKYTANVTADNHFDAPQNCLFTHFKRVCFTANQIWYCNNKQKRQNNKREFKKNLNNKKKVKIDFELFFKLVSYYTIFI